MEASRPGKYVKHNISHVRQRFNWDCGIACILMLLSEEQRNELLEDFSRICLEEGFGQTTWTIDLCYLLKRFNVKHRMYTSSLSANKRASSAEVADRYIVRNRFKNASYHGITVVEGALCTKQLISHVVTAGPAITLVDSVLLSCDWCKHNKLKSEIRRMFGGSYRGHYIVVAGWSGGRLLYLDPARTHQLCAISPSRLHAARSTPATDYDAILIYTDYNIINKK